MKFYDKEFEWVFLSFLESNRIEYKQVSGKPEVHFNCPFCQDTRQRLYINLHKKTGWCHNEQIPISPFQLFRYYNFTDRRADSYFRGGAVSLWSQLESLYQENEQQFLSRCPRISLPEGYVPLTTWYEEPLEYLRRRRIYYPQIQRYHLHYATRGKFFRRIIIPIYDHHGRMISYAGRSIDDENIPKYLFAPNTKTGETLYKAQFLQPLASRIILVEGQFPAMIFGKDFYATFGKKLSRGQLLQIFKCKPKQVIVMFDFDAKEKARQVGAILSEWFPTKIVSLPYGQPDDFSRSTLERLIQQTPFMNTTWEFERQLKTELN